MTCATILSGSCMGQGGALSWLGKSLAKGAAPCEQEPSGAGLVFSVIQLYLQNPHSQRTKSREMFWTVAYWQAVQDAVLINPK